MAAAEVAAGRVRFAMKLLPVYNRQAAFFYWLQTVAGWDASYARDSTLVRHYRQVLQSSDKLIVQQVSDILRGNPQPYAVLRELYSGKIAGESAGRIIKMSQPLQSCFEALWQQELPLLTWWCDVLSCISYDDIREPLYVVAKFLAIDEATLQNETIFLLPPSLQPKGPAGHKISGSDFILLRPPRKRDIASQNGVKITLMHEYIHGLLYQSDVFKRAAKRSYDMLIEPKNLAPPPGYTWKAVYDELFAYCMASRTIGGYLSPWLLNKPMPVVSDFSEAYERLCRNSMPSIYQRINWASLHLLPIVDEHIRAGKVIDADVFTAAITTFLNQNQQ